MASEFQILIFEFRSLPAPDNWSSIAWLRRISSLGFLVFVLEVS